MPRVIIHPTSRMLWVKQAPPPYVRAKIESLGGWIIDHEKKTISIDYNYVMVRRDIAHVLNELNDLEEFPPNVPYTTFSGDDNG